MNITLDTNFLISATQWVDSVSHKLLRNLIEKNINLFTSQEILDEFTGVLKRDFNRDEDYVERLMSILLNTIKIVEPTQKVIFVKEDPDDDKIIECALASNSNFIVTYDKHLLKLKRYNGIDIITPEIAFDYI